MVSVVIKWLDLHQGASGFLGAVVAVFFSAFGFLLKSWLDKRSERKEHQRKIEVSITTSLNQMLVVREQLKHFVDNLRKLISDIRKDTAQNHLSMETVNFPAISEIYNDANVIVYKTKSYYLHNNMLFAMSGISTMNAQISSFRETLANRVQTNNHIVDLMTQSGKVDAIQQKKGYAGNLEVLCDAVEGYIPFITKGLELMWRVKVYNDRMRKWSGLWFYWRAEGRSFKYFRNKEDFNKFSRNIDSLPRVDLLIQPEVDAELKNVEAKAPLLLTKIKK